MAYNLLSRKAIQITWGQTGARSCQGESYSSTKISAWLEVGCIKEQTCIMAKYYYYRSQIMSGFVQPPWRGKICFALRSSLFLLHLGFGNLWIWHPDHRLDCSLTLLLGYALCSSRFLLYLGLCNLQYEAGSEWYVCINIPLQQS